MASKKTVSRKKFNQLQRANYELIAYLCGGNPGWKGNLNDVRKVAIKSVRQLMTDNDVYDANSRLPTTWYDRRVLSYVARGVSYRDAVQQANRLMDMENPADLDEESKIAGKEGFFDNLKDIREADGLKDKWTEIKDTAKDLFTKGG